MYFKLDDSKNLGWAEVKILKESGSLAGRRLYKIEVTKVIKITERKVREGQKLTVSDLHLYNSLPSR